MRRIVEKEIVSPHCSDRPPRIAPSVHRANIVVPWQIYTGTNQSFHPENTVKIQGYHNRVACSGITVMELQ